jgi:hypothetical protein
VINEGEEARIRREDGAHHRRVEEDCRKHR